MVQDTKCSSSLRCELKAFGFKDEKVKNYKVMLTPYHNEIVRARNMTEAKELAWRRIKDGYRYGYKSLSEVKSRAKVQALK